MTGEQPLECTRVLITRLRFIGDIVLTTPVVRSLRNAFPKAFIAYLGEKPAVSLLVHDPHLDEVIPYDPARPSILEQARVVMELRKRRFDLVVDLFSNPRTAVLTFLSGAPTRVGLDRRGRRRLYTIRVRDDGKPKSAVEFHQQFVAALGLTPSPVSPYIVVSVEEGEKAQRYLQNLVPGRMVRGPVPPLLGIHPGATWPAKRWFPERFAELADVVKARFGADVVLTGGPKDGEIVRRVVELARSEVPVAGPLPLRQLAAVLQKCSAFITNDAGPMHIAAAVGTPTIGLFGPGEEDVWFPYPAEHGHAALRKDVPCHPCHLDVCNRPAGEFMQCMNLLTVDEVCEAINRALQAGQPRETR